MNRPIPPRFTMTSKRGSHLLLVCRAQSDNEVYALCPCVGDDSVPANLWHPIIGENGMRSVFVYSCLGFFPVFCRENLNRDARMFFTEVLFNDSR